MTAASPKPKQRRRRTQERAELTRDKLLQTAAQLFSDRGYDAVSVREIEMEAGVQRNLLTYHFGSKEGMWKSVASDLLSKLEQFREVRDNVLRDLAPHERLAYVIRSFVRFSAENPEFNRMMLHEGKRDSWRMAWLADTMLRPAAEELRELIAQDEAIHLKGDEFISWYYMFIGGGSTLFAIAPEAKHVFGVDTLTDKIIDQHAQMMVELLLSRASE
ncbi:MAG: TetR family transcriptional regulator [Pseudomonadota bacterium]